MAFSPALAPVFLTLFLAFAFLAGLASSTKSFDELFQPSWAFDHVMYEGELLKLKLDNYSGIFSSPFSSSPLFDFEHSAGSGFASKSKYMYGKTTVQIKLVEGDSAGTVTAFYVIRVDFDQMSSEGPNHHEFDFEFLGNTSGEPYLVQTNIYVNGVGNREQRLNLWFDPTTDFHSYSFLWNQRQVVFLVDETPIRVYTNKEKNGVPFPKDQPMGVYSSIWNADDWATQGGRIKTDWSHAPFIASYKGFDIDACEASTLFPPEENMRRCSSIEGRKYWWDEPMMSELSFHQSHQLKWVHRKHVVYDYCADSARFAAAPPECERRW
ncbi:Xyloglucan endotransglucosylase protein 6 [Asimina triloba]